ncbi:Uncharacterised protein [Mycobacteroides abscessus subsp. abscessus]|uniref:hypothetical protein n=1 Tax=Mycobacteroides abscessus TaxID=36809 RepID=UPI00092C2EB1|nr:hypothetical protein [Mycobacteroides abscessus]SIC62450.1 Uncharacterised protein [Mycobacteroides abscessus subsp. abscessus]SIC94098.1 Uncharacterised protein [Mycobacteroides abscessus subsp. abscessus]SID22334.1 Uncharacterised protein [Mycobacteroides abscessus subsp. abscessus]SID51690.1 Uncharacterised protein [Mycobacteroides abscessus subsp. abscessus]SKT56560.1 Uncharacterised protein [Mycobacteroides abscessus subsp. abscessus]
MLFADVVMAVLDLVLDLASWIEGRVEKRRRRKRLRREQGQARCLAGLAIEQRTCDEYCARRHADAEPNLSEYTGVSCLKHD